MSATNTPKRLRSRWSKDGGLSVYFGGDLFDHKDLVGNAILADYIEKESAGRYRCIVPQTLEQTSTRGVEIRNNDLKNVLLSDVALFNFDGTDLDSGSVVEFVYAKMLDIPAVLLRTDFRSAGDSNKVDGDPWNLMAAKWPRTKVLVLHGMRDYRRALAERPRKLQWMSRLYSRMANQVIEAFDEARSQPPIARREQLFAIYEWAISIPGNGYDELFTTQAVECVIASKTKKGLLAE